MEMLIAMVLGSWMQQFPLKARNQSRKKRREHPLALSGKTCRKTGSEEVTPCSGRLFQPRFVLKASNKR